MDIYYVYFYLREDFTPYYVGKGKGNRAYQKDKNHNPPKDKNRIIIVESNISEVSAFMLERYYIRWFGRKDIGTGILRNLTNGGEGTSGYSPTQEQRKVLSEKSKGPNPKKGRSGIFNSMYQKTHTEETKEKLSQEASIRFKGKSYEELYGKEKAENLKKIRSEKSKNKDNIGTNNPRFDKTIYTFFNKETSEIFRGVRFDFINKYNLHRGEVCGMIKNKTSHRKWIVID